MPTDEDDKDRTAPSLEDALAVYSADGQADDETGGDAGAEALRAKRARQPHEHEEMPHGPH
jgi:hypothetical protein